jgi:hypothetical protein
MGSLADGEKIFKASEQTGILATFKPRRCAHQCGLTVATLRTVACFGMQPCYYVILPVYFTVILKLEG